MQDQLLVNECEEVCVRYSIGKENVYIKNFAKVIRILTEQEREFLLLYMQYLNNKIDVPLDRIVDFADPRNNEEKIREFIDYFIRSKNT
jgi:hypothetical protein